MLAMLHQRSWAHTFVMIVRILLGFAFLPAGIKKLIGEPFTDPSKQGAFHDFLHAFHGSGWFYNSVGVLQLTIAALYFWQSELVAPLLALPVLTAIMLFTWSTGVPVTASVVTLMLLATVMLLVWAKPRWEPVFRAGGVSARLPVLVAVGPWRWCGAAVAIVYALLCWSKGGVYRPVSGAPKDAAFYVMSCLPLLPLATLAVQMVRRSRHNVHGS